MEFRLTKEQEEFRQEVIDFCRQELKPARQDLNLGLSHDPVFYKKMADKGWLGLAWPKEYGGLGKGHLYMAIFNDEMTYARAPMGAYSTTCLMVANGIIHFGSEEMKKFIIPQVVKGEVLLAWGLSEPEAGSDAANTQTTAMEDGDDYVINGKKRFITFSHIADYVQLLTRTDPNVPKHKGLTLFLVDMKLPGITVSPLWTMGDGRTNELTFENVRVPRTMMLGEKNRGWYHATTTLDFERSGIGVPGRLRRDYGDLVAYVREKGFTRGNHWQVHWIRHRLGEIGIKVKVARLLYYRVAWMQDQGLIPNQEASMTKLYTSETERELASLALDILGESGCLEKESLAAVPLDGHHAKRYREVVISTIGGGSSQIQRDIIARRGLGMQR